MGTCPAKIIHVDYTRGVVFHVYLVSRKYTFDGDFQVLAPSLQVIISQGDINEGGLFFDHPKNQ